MILVHKRQFLCHSVDVRTCSEDHRSKRFWKEFQSGLCPASWGNPPNKVSTNDFAHVMVMTFCVFDHQSWLLAPNLTISLSDGIVNKCSFVLML